MIFAKLHVNNSLRVKIQNFLLRMWAPSPAMISQIIFVKFSHSKKLTLNCCKISRNLLVFCWILRKSLKTFPCFREILPEIPTLAFLIHLACRSGFMILWKPSIIVKFSTCPLHASTPFPRIYNNRHTNIYGYSVKIKNQERLSRYGPFMSHHCLQWKIREKEWKHYLWSPSSLKIP